MDWWCVVLVGAATSLFGYFAGLGTGLWVCGKDKP